MSWAPWVLFLMSAESHFSASAILRGSEPVSALTQSFLYCCSLYNLFFLGFRQRLSRSDRVVNLFTQPSNFHCFGELELGSGPALGHSGIVAHVRAWHMGRDYSYCRTSELTDCQVSGFVFS